MMKAVARTTRVPSPASRMAHADTPQGCHSHCPGCAGWNWWSRTEARVGINCCKSPAEKIIISFWLPRFSGMDDPVPASAEWIYSPSCQRKERLSFVTSLQAAHPVHSAFLCLDVPLNACSGQRDATGCDIPCTCQKGSGFPPCKLHHGLLCRVQSRTEPSGGWHKGKPKGIQVWPLGRG